MLVEVKECIPGQKTNGSKTKILNTDGRKKREGHPLSTTIGIYRFLGVTFVSLMFLAHKVFFCKKILNTEKKEKSGEEQNILSDFDKLI